MTTKTSIPVREIDVEWQNEPPTAPEIMRAFTVEVRNVQWAVGHGTVRVFGLALKWHIQDEYITEIKRWLATDLPRLGASLKTFNYNEDGVSGGSRIEATITI